MTDGEAEAIKRIMKDIPLPVIVEVGAYSSEPFESMLSKDVVHVMVEPDPRNWPNIPRGHNRRLLKCAIAKKTGWRDFYFSDGDHGSGSLLEPTGCLTHFPHIHFEKSGTPLPCYSLDDLYSICHLSQIDLLWVDIQGAEAEMIEGGSYALSRTHYLFIEAEEVEFYKGQKVRADLLAMLPDWNTLGIFDGCNVLMENRKWSA